MNEKVIRKLNFPHFFIYLFTCQKVRENSNLIASITISYILCALSSGAWNIVNLLICVSASTADFPYKAFEDILKCLKLHKVLQSSADFACII